MSQRMIAVVAVVMALFTAALVGIFSFASHERDRDVQQIRSRLSIVANSRAREVENWLNRQQTLLNALVNNESLQLYVSVLRSLREDQAEGEAADDTDDAAELSFLRNLLEATARRGGFATATDAEPLPANVNPVGMAGLALLGPTGEVLVATRTMPPIQGDLARFVEATPLGDVGFFDLRLDSRGVPVLGWLMPVFVEQGGLAPTRVAARLLAVRPVDAEFFATLEQPGETAATAETYLIRQAGQLIEYLSPLGDGSPALSKQVAMGGADTIDTAAIEQPGAFAQGFDYRVQPAFAVSQAIPGTPWLLVHQVRQAEALQQSNRRRTMLTSILLAVLIAVGATIVLVWRFATSARVEQSAREYRASSERFEALSHFLDTVSDTLPTPIFATDTQHRITFANQRLAELTGIPKDEMHQRALLGVLGQDRGTVYQVIAEEVRQSNHSRTLIRHFGDGDEEIVWRSYHCPLPSTDPANSGVLTTIEDLTDLTQARRRRDQNTKQLINTLVDLVDERDPDSAHQSRYVAQVARQIATEMGLEAELIETADQAGRLVNLGKIRIPRAVLTKQGPLTDEERALVRTAMDQGPNLLRHLVFDGPVIETLEQINERFDGQGQPHGLAGEAILPTAQAVALANSFVALISPRSFRDGKTFDDAGSELLAEAGRRFDQRAVLSLLNFLHNKGGRAHWAFMAHRQDPGQSKAHETV